MLQSYGFFKAVSYKCPYVNTCKNSVEAEPVLLQGDGKMKQSYSLSYIVLAT